MEHIKQLLNRVIISARINGNQDVELCATILLGSIENNCVNELADSCEKFTQEKVQQIAFLKQVEKMINYN